MSTLTRISDIQLIQYLVELTFTIIMSDVIINDY